MSDADDLVQKAEKQLEEHRTWLAGQIYMMPAYIGMAGGKCLLIDQARGIKLRVVRAVGNTVSVVYDYPDELYAFLSSGSAPKHLRDSLAGGHVVDPNQPASTFVRVRDEGR